MSDTELFQEAVAPIGGLYRSGEGVSPEVADHVETHFAWLAQYARVLESEARCAFRPCFGLIANREFNAVAFRIESGTACVGINVGAIQAIDGIFCRMMASRSIMVQIGSIEKEVEQLPLQSPHLETLTDSMTAQTLPRCPTRRWFADAHTKQAIRFLLRHELAHIANGHVDFLAAQHGQRFTTELDWINGDASAQFDRQVIEFDADCCAASWWCGVFLEEWFKQSGCLKPSEMADAEVDLAVKDELGMAFFQWRFPYLRCSACLATPDLRGMT